MTITNSAKNNAKPLLKRLPISKKTQTANFCGMPNRALAKR
ncbi:hypothetical protein QG070_09385 [Kingella kingae]|nr:MULTISPECIES: hypothetical protein [Kingella]MDK4556058.1 hypothetical protein [Kingella kingae]MDK4577098.1 hypothetical protein [Kingella kingae]MDK4583124.1 hypothetical protein [Kingella kingae]MDK4585117.1 hypothetical protein [Kingella kingae]MDK4589118.1 hypothetical protein [Kingella kingae]